MNSAPRVRPGSIFRSALLSIFTRWTDRLFGLASTVVLARLLAPEDFGLVAMAAVFVGLADVLVDLGVSVAVIHRGHISPPYLNTAWTLRIAQSAVAAAGTLIVAPWASSYYQNDQISSLMSVMAVTMLIGGFENIGIILFQQGMRFDLDFRFFFLRRIFGFVVTLILAWALGSFWALAFGALATRTFGVLLSYILHEHRPRLTLQHAREMLSFSQWILLSNVGSFVDGKLDRFIVGRMFDAPTVGTYSMADDVAAIPTSDLLAPLNRVLFPALVAVREKADELRRGLLLALGVQSIVGMPAGLGLALMADEVVRVMLGEAWLGAVPVLQVMGLIGAVRAIGYSGGYLLLVFGRVKLLSVLAWLQVLAFAVTVSFMLPNIKVVQIAEARLLIGFVAFCFVAWLVTRTVRTIRPVDLVVPLLRPFFGCVSMAVVVLSFSPWPGAHVASILAAKALLGTFAYIVAVLLAWLIAGRPGSAEAYMLSKFGLGQLCPNQP